MIRLIRFSVILLLGSLIFPFTLWQNSISAAIRAPDDQGFAQSRIKTLVRAKNVGYKAVIRYEDGFLAAGSGGRIDHLSASGDIIKSDTFPGENFNSLSYDGERVIAGGDNGTLLISPNKGIFRKVDSGTNSDIHSLVFFNGKIIAGADHGEIITWEDPGSFKKFKPGVKGNIVSVSARSSACYGVTDEGEIVHSVNGTDWKILDFNRVYSGYYKPCRFTRILVTEKRMAVAGYRDDGSPVLYFSSQGNVWTERPLNYNDELGITCFLEAIPNDLQYDEPSDQFILVCSNGRLMKLPSCSQCNKLAVLCEENLEGISIWENMLITVGENFLIKTIDIR